MSTQNFKPENDQSDCSRRNEGSMRNNQTPQQPITQSRQRGAQTTPAHLHWCGAYQPSSWPAQDASSRVDASKQDSHFRHFPAALFRVLDFMITSFALLFRICQRTKAVSPSHDLIPPSSIYIYTCVLCTNIRIY